MPKNPRYQPLDRTEERETEIRTFARHQRAESARRRSRPLHSRDYGDSPVRASTYSVNISGATLARGNKDSRRVNNREKVLPLADQPARVTRACPRRRGDAILLLLLLLPPRPGERGSTAAIAALHATGN